MRPPSTEVIHTRRALLAGLGAGVVSTSLAGCSSLTAPHRQRWAYPFEGIPNADVTVTPGTVLLRTSTEDEGRLTAVGRGSGEEVWSVPIALAEYSFAFHEASGTVLAAGPEMLVGLDVADGERRFTVPVGTPAVNYPPTVAADEAGFVVLRRDGGLLALDADGGERWRTDATVGAPVAGGLITTVAPEYDPDDGDLTALRAFRAETGEERFRIPFEAMLIRGAAVRGDRVYTATVRGGVRCLDATEGSQRWYFGHPTREDLTTPPLVVGDTVYVGSSVRFNDRDYGTVFAVSGPDGRSGFEYRTETGVRALANGGEGRVFAAVGESVRGLDTETMTADWQVSLDPLLLAGSDDTCFVVTRPGGDGEGRLLALEAD